LRWILLAIVLGCAAFLAYYLLQDRSEQSPPPKVTEKSGDQLTEEDRQGLTKLIESKKAEEEGDKNP
jgi:hypothetical protein